jgi:hypothetical protein
MSRQTCLPINSFHPSHDLFLSSSSQHLTAIAISIHPSSYKYSLPISILNCPRLSDLPSSLATLCVLLALGVSIKLGCSLLGYYSKRWAVYSVAYLPSRLVVKTPAICHLLLLTYISLKKSSFLACKSPSSKQQFPGPFGLSLLEWSFH